MKFYTAGLHAELLRPLFLSTLLLCPSADFLLEFFLAWVELGAYMNGYDDTDMRERRQRDVQIRVATIL